MYQESWAGGPEPGLRQVDGDHGAWQGYGGQAEGLGWGGSLGQRGAVGLGGVFGQGSSLGLRGDDRLWANTERVTGTGHVSLCGASCVRTGEAPVCLSD